MSIYQSVFDSSNINLYSSRFWNIVAGPSRQICSTDCQDNAVICKNNTKLYSFCIASINNKNLVVESGPGGTKYASAVIRADNTAGQKIYSRLRLQRRI